LLILPAIKKTTYCAIKKKIHHNRRPGESDVTIVHRSSEHWELRALRRYYNMHGSYSRRLIGRHIDGNQNLIEFMQVKERAVTTISLHLLIQALESFLRLGCVGLSV
jgi:hypothetical protein